MPILPILAILAILAMQACGKDSVPVAAFAAPAPAVLPLAGFRPTFDFVANRAHAVVHRGRHLVMTAGTPDFLKYIDGGWKTSWILGQKDAGKAVAFVSGLSAVFFCPLDVDGDGPLGEHLSNLTLTVSLRALVAGQRLSVFANEKAIATVDVTTELKDYAIPLPASALALGENRFRLTFRSAAPVPGGRRAAAAIERIAIGPAASVLPAPAPLVGETAFGGVTKRALVSAGPSRLSFYVQIPKESAGRLALSYGSSTAGSTAVVRIAQDGVPVRILFSGPAGNVWTDAAWDISAYKGQAVRIDLISRGGGIAWAEPRLLVQAAPAAPPPPAKKVDRVFVWMVDTLRADKVQVYNPHTVVQTPNYDAFAADATRFAWAQVPGTWSLPSHASILTGVYPGVHKATAHEARLSRQVPFIAEVFKKAGFRTALFSSNGYISSKWGFDRGWDETRNFIRESLPNGAEYLWKTARTWITANGRKPQFVYLATVDPHVIYNPRKEFLQLYWKKPYHGPIKPALTGVQLGQIKSGKLKPDADDRAYLEALHNAEITQSDRAFAGFLSDLKAAGLYDTSAVIVISDHGDEFWDHGDVGHAQSVYQELVHIPLIIRAPGILPTGKVIDVDVEAMDLFPTMLDLAGLPVSDDIQGRSLLSVARDELAFTPSAALSQNLGMLRGIKVGRYRLIQGGLSRVELYDEFGDPREQQNVAQARPIALRQMRNVLGLLVAFENRWKKATWGTAANVKEAFYADGGRRP